MEDLISRNALIAEYDRVHVGAAGGARKLMQDAPAVNRWIPCIERMPEQNRMVIVCYFGSDLIIPRHGETLEEAMERIRKIPTVTLGMYDEEGWCGADFFPLMVRPTFWMNLPDAPLPEPPESEVRNG